MHSRRLTALRVMLLAAFLTSCAWARAAEATPTQTWLVVSDIHLDPFNHWSDPSLPGRDTNLALFSSALSQMQRDVPRPSMVLLPGDFLAHDFPSLVRRQGSGTSVNAAGLATMRFIAAAFARAYPRARFAIAVGNNDAPCGDYRADVADDYLASLARVWAPLIDREGAAASFERSFSRGGYYTAALPLRGYRLVVLNTVLFSGEYKGSCTPRASDAAHDELVWMNATLQNSPRGMRNIVMMHVPPGYDAFSTQVTKGFIPWAFLNANDNAALIAALTARSDRVAYAFAAHTHHFDFRLIDGISMIVFGSVSPVYRNNPSFYALKVGSDGSLRDIDAYAYDEWNGDWTAAHSFDREWLGRQWKVGRVDTETLQSIHQQLSADPAMRRAWDIASNGWPSGPSTSWEQWGSWWRASWCAQTVMEAGFAQCAGIERRVTLGRLLVGVAVALAIAAVAVLAWFGARAWGLIAR
ncbi:MAG: metallophosphoesterase [Candidatus Eremiobacteraeota bacterium]|nr:metallophosphoesterase [Candidatus Eremiobacteraeota bacterium]